MDWRFYGRTNELDQIRRLLERNRWFFCAITGRRRIGKTHLIQEAMRRRSDIPSLYVQIPDSEEMRVVRAFRDAIEDCELTTIAGLKLDQITDFITMARAISILCRAGVIVILDEFQYFHRKLLAPFLSFLQAEVDQLRDGKRGGLFILGSIHTEMISLIEDSSSPLFGRITDELKINHWDFATLAEVFDAHGIKDQMHRLFLWGLLEGVPKFYRDAHEAGILGSVERYRETTLQQLFFSGTSPLRDEAEHWFLRELRGRYDTVLDILARRQPCGHGDLMAEYRGFGEEKALAGYIQQLTERLEIVERLEPVFAPNNHRRGRYVIKDNFLSAWLSSIDRAVKMAKIRPVRQAVERANDLLQTREGFVFEKMIKQLLEEQSRLGIGQMELSDHVKGYWDRPDTEGASIEIDMISYNEETRTVRFGSCKRSPTKHNASELKSFQAHVAGFLKTKMGRRFTGWTMQHALYAPAFSTAQRKDLSHQGFLCISLQDLMDNYDTP